MSPELPHIENLVLLVEAGGRSYGTSNDDSDHDYVALTIETPEQVFSLNAADTRTRSLRSQPVGQPSGRGDWDVTVHPLRRWLALAAKGNPNALETLWGPVLVTSPVGIGLRCQRELFIGRHIINPYLGYVHSQRERYFAHEDPSDVIDGEQAKPAMHVARLLIQAKQLLEQRQLELPISEPWLSWLLEVRAGNMQWGRWARVVEALTRSIEIYRHDESIPATADTQAIVAWSIHAHQEWWDR